MVAIGLFFGLLAAVVLTLVRVLLRRGSRPTENADGLLIERTRRQMAAHDRQSFSAMAQHNTTPTMGDSYRLKG
ncbi:hypothetical protein ABZT08_25360 [Streptomyces sp. NPDC005526]|uniref:hypothetical protein n=1 Tax=Streptomyces sp. NPDC005526 TaxID=3156885 RepID=UPI0033A3ED77